MLDLVEEVAAGFEVAGVLVMVGGTLLAVAMAWRDRSAGGRTLYRNFRHSLGRAILLTLEFLVAADILRTMAETPTIRQVIVLGGIVAIRTFLSFTLEVELENRWPWQPRPVAPEAVGAEDRRVHSTTLGSLGETPA